MSSILRISGHTVTFSFISIVVLFLALLSYGITNDYIIYEMQNITETLEFAGSVVNGTSAHTQVYADSYRNFIFGFDNLWFLAYLVLVISSFILAYQSKGSNYFGYFFYLFYGLMFVLFALTIFESLTDWFKINLFLPILPNSVVLLPKFYYYLDHLGIFTAVHIALCLLLNLSDFNFGKIFARKKQEQLALADDEVV